jgi:peptidoglycan/xylan/chitin deacetylase (PgdA/CDA1 family)
LARMMTRHGLRILCYHGFSVNDEHLFRPKLFMRKKVLERRLNKIAQMGFSIISLDQAVSSFSDGKNLTNALVITVDDGWQGVEDIAAPLFSNHQFPWTLYLTTYYVEKQSQVTNVAIQYLCWKTTRTQINIHEIDADLNEIFSLSNLHDRALLSNRLISLQEKLKTADERQAFVREIALLLKVNQAVIEKEKLFHLLEKSSIKKLHHAGVDIQLHTHHHSLGKGGKETICSEIASNRSAIEEVCQHRAVHFCYPSGIYDESFFATLSELGVLSATTCNPGLNYASTNIMELGRFLDGENVSELEFEAELSGFSELIRKVVRLK